MPARQIFQAQRARGMHILKSGGGQPSNMPTESAGRAVWQRPSNDLQDTPLAQAARMLGAARVVQARLPSSGARRLASSAWRPRTAAAGHIGGSSQPRSRRAASGLPGVPWSTPSQTQCEPHPGLPANAGSRRRQASPVRRRPGRRGQCGRIFSINVKAASLPPPDRTIATKSFYRHSL